MCSQRKHHVARRIVYFSGLLQRRIPDLLNEISKALKTCGVEVRLLQHTKDIWCRDYMPVRIGEGKFIQFKYDPEYLKTKNWRVTKTNPITACKAIRIKPFISDIVLDGGNVVRYGKKAVMTWQVFNDNPSYSQEDLKSSLKNLLRVNEVIIIPPEPDDLFCHADGSVRFINKNLVAINRPHKMHARYDESLRKILKEHKLSWIELPYSIDHDKQHPCSAVGNYVNFLAIGNTVLVPAYKSHEAHNREAAKTLSRWFKKVIPIESTALAKRGGVLNCVSWGK